MSRPVQEAQRPRQAIALLDIAKSMLSSYVVYGGVFSVPWSDVAVVFIAGVGTPDCSAVRVTACPLSLVELACVIVILVVIPVLK